MPDISDILNTGDADAAKTVELEKLSELVEAQIDDVLGGGYSQYSAAHGKSAAL